MFIQRLLKWLDDHLLTVLAGFLLAFIPLYPKWPLFDILPGYIVRVRLEDFIVSATILVFLIWLARGKVSFGPNPLSRPLGIYLTIGLLSMISAVFITQTVPLEGVHLAKMTLHFLRRLEYFSLFFIFFSTVKSLREVKIYLTIFILTIVGISIYGFGQRYLYWPAFSTMNREFSKGWWLYLTPHARVLSTFGGHYDLAAWTMMALVFLWSLFFGVRSKILKMAIFVVLAGAFWLLILTASRTSFLAYLGATALVILFWSFKKGLEWGISRFLAVFTLSILVMLSFGDLSERFTRLLRLDERLGGIKELVLRPLGIPPQERAVFLENNLGMVSSQSDQPPSPIKPGTRPIDVYEDIPEIKIATISGVTKIIQTPRTYSRNAMLYDLSTGIRLDVLWPRAIAGFMKNPILGSGYSTLVKAKVEEFTEAESTDNDYLRSLGETGLLGFLAFFGSLIFILVIVFKSLAGITDAFVFGLTAGLGAAVFGLLINALYIDVFEASKVAFSFWALMGILLGTIKISKDSIEKNKKPLRLTFNSTKWIKILIRFLRSDFFLILLLCLLAFIPRLYRKDEPLADWHSWRQADTAAVTRNFIKNGAVNLLYPTYDDLSSIPSGKPNPKGYRFVEFPLYNAATVFVRRFFPEGPMEGTARMTSALISLGSLGFLFLLVKKYLNRLTATLAAFFFALLPFNIFYSRSILPEPTLVFFSLGMIYFFDKHLEENSKLPSKSKKYYVLSWFFATCTILVKPYAAFFFLPMVYLWLRRKSHSFFSFIPLFLYFFISLLPFILWRLWISQHPEGVPAFDWLLNGDGIRFKGAFFYWLFAERLVKLILGYWGLPLLLLGILVKPKEKEGWFFYWWGIATLLYVTVFATGNVRHDYYQIMTIPIICIFLAKGAEFLIKEGRRIFNFVSCYLLLVICILFMLAFGWYQVRDFFNINHPEIVEAGREVEKISNSQALIIAPYGGDTAFLYQTNRAGWPIVDGSLEEMIRRGADYFVSVNFDDFTNNLIRIVGLGNDYKIIKQTPRYVIIQLVPDVNLPKG